MYVKACKLNLNKINTIYFPLTRCFAIISRTVIEYKMFRFSTYIFLNYGAGYRYIILKNEKDSVKEYDVNKLLEYTLYSDQISCF